ncbi:MAG: AIPR family protein, partial [Anaerolineae bacterium]|nr:AIPR family protein [Anaerolineae bacterium]
SRSDFEDNCYVLVRLLRRDAVNQISDVVFATNNQNPMQPRNLVSNSEEQVEYFQYFGNNLGWFYEAKQGAWEAFRRDDRNWRPRLRKSASHFKAKGTKKVDNLDLAQNWLSFLGFPDRAANERKYLFDQDKDYYTLIFLRRLRHHACDRYSSLAEAINDCEDSRPNPQIMLAAHLAHLFADAVVPSAQANRKQALYRKGIVDREGISPPEEAIILSEDNEYLLNQVLGTMSYVFVEFIGYSMFRQFGQETHRYGDTLLRNHSWQLLYKELDLDTVADRAVGATEFVNDDLLIVMWLFFREAVDTILGGAWRESYRNTRYKPRFVLNNRNQLYKEMERMDQALQRHIPMRIWTNGMKPGEGFFGYIQRIIESRQ